MKPSHLDRVRDDAEYAEILAGWNPEFYTKYIEALKPLSAGGKVLDIGCGVGQVVAALAKAGYSACGVDVSAPNIEIAQKHAPSCILYDGGNLPYPAGHFDRVGALNVLEHVQDPEGFVREAVRVCAPGGRVVLSSPNFLRGIGFRDYHPRMRGLGNKLRNMQSLLGKRQLMRQNPDKVRFERMEPIIKQPFTPDDDAIVATNALDMRFFLERNGCRILEVACTDRLVPGWIDFLLNFSPLKYAMFNAWVIAEKEG